MNSLMLVLSVGVMTFTVALPTAYESPMIKFDANTRTTSAFSLDGVDVDVKDHFVSEHTWKKRRRRNGPPPSPPSPPLNPGVTLVFTKDEIQKCTRIRTPSLMLNSHTGSAHVIARCCGPNECSSKSLAQWSSDDASPAKRVGDNDKDAKVIMKTSKDGGKTWTGFQVLSPGVSYSNGAGIYDRLSNKLVVQYNFIPGGSTSPVVDTTLWQITSSDDGATWSKPVNISGFLSPCNPDRNNMQVQSAGSKVQTASGRLIWAGHDHSGNVCVWFSDDHGVTYHTSNVIPGNEVSVAVANAEKHTLYMNGRQQSPWAPHRTDYYSYDDGKTWTNGSKSELVEDSSGGCERSVINVGGVLYSMEPQGDKRTAMVASCSRDQGKTWTSTRGVNGNNRGGYSDMVGLPNGKILAVWEDGSHPLATGAVAMDPSDEDSGNFFAKQIGTEWCS